MKKLMVMAAAVVMTVAAQAAQVAWTAERGALSDYASSVVYFINASSYTKAIEALKAGGENVATEFAKYVNSTATAKNGAFAAVTAYNVEDKAAFIIFADNAIVEGGSYDTTGLVDISANVYTPPDTAPGKVKLTNDMFSSKGNAIGSVPEPTSGLLLLLGMAGLALRRRRA